MVAPLDGASADHTSSYMVFLRKKASAIETLGEVDMFVILMGSLSGVMLNSKLTSSGCVSKLSSGEEGWLGVCTSFTSEW
jgi:hypothetical protein